MDVDLEAAISFVVSYGVHVTKERQRRALLFPIRRCYLYNPSSVNNHIEHV